ncbi:very short patch repair endonuclease [Rhizobium leguminosarum]|uniref:very short patch repair endonuclease n=1 Tax=Rhizobium leguminosarum TaxID=384 RepID=UPI0032B00914
MGRLQLKNATPASPEVGLRLAKVRQRGTTAELKLRKALHAKGLRYSLHVPLLSKPRRVADVSFPKTRVAVFVDGCFWHGCPIHGSWPKNNADFWREKIEANRARDADTDQRLANIGWTVVRVWEHENAQEAADRIADIVRSRRSLSGNVNTEVGA